MSSIGHNSGSVGGIASDRLRSFVERIERLESEKKGIQTDIKEVYDEAKGTGFDASIIKELIKLRKMDAAARQEREALLELYMDALGMFSNTPLGRAAMEREEKVKEPQTDIEDAIKAANDPGAAPIFFEAMETQAGRWTVFHNGAMVYVPMCAEEEAGRIVDALTDRAAEFGRNLTTAEVRETVLTFVGPDFGPSFNPPYSAYAIQDDAKEAGAATANARATNEGWDAGADGKTAEDCPYSKKEKTLRDRWMFGLKRHQDGGPRPFVTEAAPQAANDDQPAATSSTVAA